MCTRHLSRRLVGLLAAYLVVLPALILPLAMPAAASATSLCATGHGVPAGQDQACPCAAVCGLQCQQPALSADEAACLPAPQLHVVAVLAPAALVAAPPPALRQPQMPRGPPEA